MHRIDLGQWPQAMYVTNNRAAFNRFMRTHCSTHDHKSFPARNGGLTIQLENDPYCMFVIAVGEHEDPIELASTMAHEATHAMRWILQHVGEKVPGTETEAYLVEHIVRRGLMALA